MNRRPRKTESAWRFSYRLAGVFCFVLLLLGCGKRVAPWGSVKGTITHNGQPVSAIVLFSNRAAGIEMTAETDAEGHFTMHTDRIAGLPVGTYRVTVSPKGVNPTPPEQGMMFTGPPPTVDSKIPPQYQDVATTTLTADVHEGANDFSFQLQP